MSACAGARVYVCVGVPACVRTRARRLRESERLCSLCVCMPVRERESVHMCVCFWVRARLRACARVCARVRVFVCVCVRVCVCVCDRLALELRQVERPPRQQRRQPRRPAALIRVIHIRVTDPSHLDPSRWCEAAPPAPPHRRPARAARPRHRSESHTSEPLTAKRRREPRPAVPGRSGDSDLCPIVIRVGVRSESFSGSVSDPSRFPGHLTQSTRPPREPSPPLGDSHTHTR